MDIEYRPITNQFGYFVANDGSVWSNWGKGPGADTNHKLHKMKARTDREGYRRVTFRDRTSAKVAVLVLTAFVGPCPRGMECCHGPSGNGDDSIDNLRWGTHVENIADKRLHGTMARGDRHGKVKLTEEQISEIMSLKGTATQKTVADRFGVSRGYVGQLWSGARARVNA